MLCPTSKKRNVKTRTRAPAKVPEPGQLSGLKLSLCPDAGIRQYGTEIMPVDGYWQKVR